MAAHGNLRATVIARTRHGTVEIRPDPAHPDGWTVLLDGVAQSYVDPNRPRHLAFEYVRRIARLIDVAAPAGAPRTVLHLGGGGLTLPRYVAATRPGSTQRVVERDTELIALLQRLLPVPDGIVVEAGDARAFVDRATAAACSPPPPGHRPGGYGPGHDGYDLIVVDVFAGAAMPASVAGVGFAAAVARLARPGGLIAVNLTDVPPLAYSRTQVATLRTAWREVCLVAGTGMLGGRRAGNVVLAASAGDLPVARLASAVARDPLPGRVLHGEPLDAFVAGARPRAD